MHLQGMRTSVLTVTALIAAVGISGCRPSAAPTSAPPDTACTRIGVLPNGVMVHVRGSVSLAGAAVTACTNAGCQTAAAKGGEVTSRQVFVKQPAISTTKPITISVTVRSRDGRVIAPRTEQAVIAVKEQPNGPDCPPTAYLAKVSVP